MSGTCINLVFLFFRTFSFSFFVASLDVKLFDLGLKFDPDHLAQVVRGFIERTSRVKHVENPRTEQVPNTSNSTVQLHSTIRVPSSEGACFLLLYFLLLSVTRLAASFESLNRHVVSRAPTPEIESFHLEDRPSIFEMKILSLLLRADAQLFVLLSIAAGTAYHPARVCIYVYTYIYYRTARVRYRSLILLPCFIHSRLLIKPTRCACRPRREFRSKLHRIVNKDQGRSNKAV